MKINLTHWPLMRIIRVAIAIGCFYTYYQGREWFVLAIGLLMFVQALFNTGCPDNSCELPKHEHEN
ncbi:MAG: hypothetical protein ACWA41_10725 [Putridiphycobacter sp.]